MLQLAVSAGDGSYADGQDDGVDEGQVVEEQHPPLDQVLGILPGEIHTKPQQLRRQHGGAHQQDLPPPALEKLQFQQFHRLAAFPVSSRKMSSRLLCRSSSRMTPKHCPASRQVS